MNYLLTAAGQLRTAASSRDAAALIWLGKPIAEQYNALAFHGAASPMI